MLDVRQTHTGQDSCLDATVCLRHISLYVSVVFTACFHCLQMAQKNLLLQVSKSKCLLFGFVKISYRIRI